MENFSEIELSIIEYRNILKFIKEYRDLDFTDYALTSLKRRFENAMSVHGIKQSDFLVERIKEDEPFFQHFLQEISVEGTEMFRDPSLWRQLKDVVFPSLFIEPGPIRFWLPFSVSGDELFTLAIVLKENNWLDKAEIFVSVINNLVQDRIQSGYFKKTNYDNKRSTDLNLNMAMAFSGLEKADSADIYLLKAKEENLRWNGHQKNITNGLILKFQADELVKKQQDKDAIPFYQQAIMQFSNGFNENETAKNPESFSSTFSYINLFNTLTAKGDAFERLYNMEKGLKDLENSLAAYKSAFSLADYVEKTYGVKDAVQKQFPGAIVQRAHFDEKSTKNPKGLWNYLDSCVKDNHILWKVTIPDGPELSIDFHGHNSKIVGAAPKIMRPYDESKQEWKKWLGEDEFIESVDPPLK